MSIELKLKKTYIQTVLHPKSFTMKTGWIYETEHRAVVLMSIVGIYAMVRRKGCMPYVCGIKELTEVAK
jgi:hypothetical protein